MDKPSNVDEETMDESFGDWNFVVMIILTKGGRFYARTEFTHEFPSSAKQRVQVPCEVEVVWTEGREQEVGKKTLSQWEADFQELVSEGSDVWLDTTWWNKRPKPRKGKKKGRTAFPVRRGRYGWKGGDRL